ncbi:MAG: hypothetical protein GF388_10255 [Candidatus Aegiribacteria sp.]|nr:hypothetical protein [Candidatus Aegiribacteria sp.]MBD3295415.1 hypothetical protein [Candidatus Fermentibacteria bacterium]
MEAVTEGLLVWVVLCPLLGAVAVLFGKLMKSLERFFCRLAVASIAVSAVFLVLLLKPLLSGTSLIYFLGGWPEPVGISLIMNGMAWISCALTAAIAMAVALFSLGRGRYGARFFFFLLVMVGGMYGVALTGDIFTMFVCFEIVAVSVYVLIAYEGTATGLAASLKYLILSTVGILFFLFGVFLMYRNTGVLSIAGISAALQSADGLRNTHVMHLALASLCVGIGVRTAFIPFHTWLPEAHAYAPHPVSALLSGAMIKISFFAMVRIILRFQGQYLMELLTWIGAFTALAAVISALAQKDVKRLLAYHSISQLGYILAVFGAGSAVALTASFFHAVNHALFKSLLFLTVGAAVSRAGSRNVYEISGLGGRMPLFAAAYFVGALSICGIPPFNGYASKAFITLGMKGSPAYPLLWATSFLTIASFIKLSGIFLPAADGRVSIPAAGPLPGKLEKLTVGALALACLGTGLFGIPVAEFLSGLLYGHPADATPLLFSFGSLLKVVPLPLLGYAVYRLISTGSGREFSFRVRNLAPDLQMVLVFFFAGLLAFAAAAY